MAYFDCCKYENVPTVATSIYDVHIKIREDEIQFHVENAGCLKLDYLQFEFFLEHALLFSGYLNSQQEFDLEDHGLKLSVGNSESEDGPSLRMTVESNMVTLNYMNFMEMLGYVPLLMAQLSFFSHFLSVSLQ